jgi:hypothetical protein
MTQDRTKPTDEGMRRYPPEGYFTSHGWLRLACSCNATCYDRCAGECGCEACEQSTRDSLD